jgi:hypothetical protein
LLWLRHFLLKPKDGTGARFAALYFMIKFHHFGYFHKYRKKTQQSCAWQLRPVIWQVKLHPQPGTALRLLTTQFSGRNISQ